jgi:hypothetical protein
MGSIEVGFDFAILRRPAAEAAPEAGLPAPDPTAVDPGRESASPVPAGAPPEDRPSARR